MLNLKQNFYVHFIFLKIISVKKVQKMKNAHFLLFTSLAALFALTWQHHFGPSPKNDPFMQIFQALNGTQRQGFFQITANPNVTLHEVKEQLTAFAQQNGVMVGV